MTAALARSILGSLLALAVAVWAGCAPASSPAAPTAKAAAPQAAQPPVAPAAAPTALQKVRYGDGGTRGDVGVYVGMDEGYFAEQGIEVELTPFGSAANTVVALATNQLDAAGGAPSASLYNALRNGVNLRIVAGRGGNDPTPPGFPVSIYLVRKALVDSGRVKSVADLKGLRHAQSGRGVGGEVDLVAFLKQGGLTPSDLDTTIMNLPDMVSAFANDNLDFAASVEPFATIALGQGSVTVLGYDYEVNPHYQVAVLLYSAVFSQSDLAVKFMAAQLRGVRLYLDGFREHEPAAREKAIDALMQHTALKQRALYDQMTVSGLEPDGRLNLNSFEQQQDWFIGTGAQQGRVDLQQFIDLQHLEAALGQLGPYTPPGQR
jgi:NitT/TauT family transport system substrate-binding protein